MGSKDKDNEGPDFHRQAMDTAFQRTQQHKQGVKEEKLQQQQKENQSPNSGTKK